MRETIFDVFRLNNSKAGQMVFLQGITANVDNENRQEIFQELDRMVKKGLLALDDDRADAIYLTEQGYDKMNQMAFPLIVY